LKPDPASQLPDPALIALVGSIRAELGTGDCEVIVTDLMASPAVYGLFRPKLLVPASFAEQLPPPEFRLVIAHESGHCRQGILRPMG
jgi:beta-lactamase regulating signal transducer with metallopeptidase domain